MVRPVVVQDTPQAPERVTVRASDGPTVTLRWTASIFPPPAVAFVVERADDEEFRNGSTLLKADAGATTLTDDAVQSGRTYFYRVRSEGALGSSPWSAPAEVTVP